MPSAFPIFARAAVPSRWDLPVEILVRVLRSLTVVGSVNLLCSPRVHGTPFVYGLSVGSSSLLSSGSRTDKSKLVSAVQRALFMDDSPERESETGAALTQVPLPVAAATDVPPAPAATDL